MKDRLEDTPPPSPGLGPGDGDDELFEDQIEEEVDILDGEAEVSGRKLKFNFSFYLADIFREILMMLTKMRWLSCPVALTS